MECPVCKSTNVEKETYGRSNPHGVPAYQVTIVIAYCMDCNAVINQTVYSATNDIKKKD